MSASHELMKEIAEAVRLDLATAGVPGAALTVTIDGHAATAGVGFRDLDRRDPLRANARFYLYSITKLLLATATLQLIEQGDATLDQPIRELLPDLPSDVSATLRQVLNHTAGLPDYGAMEEYTRDFRADPAQPWTDEMFLTRTLRTGLLFPPGQGWAYSNVGYLLVRRVVERLTGSTLSEALDRLIFTPLGLRHTAVAATVDDARGPTPGFSRDLAPDGGWRDVTGRYHPGWVAHGLVISTAPETARILDVLFSGRLLSLSSLGVMLQGTSVPGAHPPFRCPGYGLGVMIDSCSPFGLLAGHAGGGPGFAAAAFHAPRVAGHRITVVALLNRDHPSLATELVLSALSAIKP